MKLLKITRSFPDVVSLSSDEDLDDSEVQLAVFSDDESSVAGGFMLPFSPPCSPFTAEDDDSLNLDDGPWFMEDEA